MRSSDLEVNQEVLNVDTACVGAQMGRVAPDGETRRGYALKLVTRTHAGVGDDLDVNRRDESFGRSSLDVADHHSSRFIASVCAADEAVQALMDIAPGAPLCWREPFALERAPSALTDLDPEVGPRWAFSAF